MFPFLVNCFVYRYLITNFKIVPRGTEGAVSVEGTLAGLLASALLAAAAHSLGNVCLSLSQNPAFFQLPNMPAQVHICLVLRLTHLRMKRTNLKAETFV